jgi:hypothetical protein
MKIISTVMKKIIYERLVQPCLIRGRKNKITALK